MKIKQITVTKEFKCGLPNYSNLTTGLSLTVEIKEGEEVNFPRLWDKVNRELEIQSATIEPNWMITKEYKNFFRTTIKTPKGNNND